MTQKKAVSYSVVSGVLTVVPEIPHAPAVAAAALGSSSIAGELKYNTDTRSLNIATGSAWVPPGVRVSNVRAFGAVGDASTDDGPAIDAAITALGVGGGILYFPTTSNAYYTLTSHSLPSNVRIMVDVNASIFPAPGRTFTLRSLPIAGNYQIFLALEQAGGTGGSIVFEGMQNSPKDVFVDWWGANNGSGPDASDSFIAARAACAPGAWVVFSEGTYNIGNSLTEVVDKPFLVRGSSRRGTSLNWNGGAGGIMFDVGGVDPVTSELRIEGLALGATETIANFIRFDGMQHIRVRDCHMEPNAPVSNAAIRTINNMYDVVIENVGIYARDAGNIQNGIVMDRGGNMMIIKCYIDNMTQDAIVLGDGVEQITASVEDTSIQVSRGTRVGYPGSATARGILLQSCLHASLRNVKILLANDGEAGGTTLRGIRIEQCSGGNISGMIDCAGIAQAAITIGDNEARDVKIDGLTIRNYPNATPKAIERGAGVTSCAGIRIGDVFLGIGASDDLGDDRTNLLDRVLDNSGTPTVGIADAEGSFVTGGLTNITAINHLRIGHTVTVRAAHATQFVNSASLRMQGSVNFTTAVGNLHVFQKMDDENVYEVSRVVA